MRILTIKNALIIQFSNYQGQFFLSFYLFQGSSIIDVQDISSRSYQSRNRFDAGFFRLGNPVANLSDVDNLNVVLTNQIQDVVLRTGADRTARMIKNRSCHSYNFYWFYSIIAASISLLLLAIAKKLKFIRTYFDFFPFYNEKSAKKTEKSNFLFYSDKKTLSFLIVLQDKTGIWQFSDFLKKPISAGMTMIPGPKVR